MMDQDILDRGVDALGALAWCRERRATLHFSDGYVEINAHYKGLGRVIGYGETLVSAVIDLVHRTRRVT